MMTIISSGALRGFFSGTVTVGGGSSRRTCSACTPLRPSATPNSTRCPCLRAVVPAGSAVECTKTSPPSSRARKPYPLSESYHLTLPVGTQDLTSKRTDNNQRSGDRQDAMGDSKVIGPRHRNAASYSLRVSDVARQTASAGRPGHVVRPHTFGWCWDGIACEA